MTDTHQENTERMFKSLFAKRREAKLRKALTLKSLDKASQNADLSEAIAQLDVIKDMDILTTKELLDDYAQKRLAIQELQDRGVRAVVPCADSGRYMLVTHELAKKLVLKNGLRKSMPPVEQLKSALEDGTISPEEYNNVYKLYFNEDGSPSFPTEAETPQPTDYSPLLLENYRKYRKKNENRGN